MTGGARKGAGRPRVYPEGRVSRNLSLDKRADDAITEHATRLGVSRSRAASDLILSSPKPSRPDSNGDGPV